MKYWMTMLACVLASNASAQSGAQASASASLSQFRLELIDLAPEDGQAPQLIFYNRYANAQSELWQTWEGAYQWSLRTDYRYTDGTSLVRYDDHVAAATAQLHYASSVSRAGTDLGGIGIALLNEYYWLSPHIRLTAHWLAETNATRTADNIGRGSIEVYSDIFSTAANTAEFMTFSLASTHADGAKSQPLSIEWITGEKAATGVFRLRTEARIDPSVTPIPEPQTWAMLLAGALLITGAARGRLTKDAS